MLKGVALKVAATFVFAIMSALIKIASARFPVAEVVLFRSAFALVVLVAWLASRGEFPRALHTKRPLGHVGRSLAGTGGMFSAFIVLSLLPLADATAFAFVTPLMIVPLAAILLQEEVAAYRWTAVGLGFIGVLIMLSDHLGEGMASSTSRSAIGVAVALAGACFSAVAMIQTRRLTQSEPTGAIVFYFSSLTALFSLIVLVAAALWPTGAPGASLIAGQAFAPMTVWQFAMLAAIGTLGGMGQILMTHSYRFADASIIAAFDYVAMIWAAALGYLLFAETPTPRIVLGACVVAGAGIFVLWRERERRRIRLLEEVV